jgi:hypothetical protein
LRYCDAYDDLSLIEVCCGSRVLACPATVLADGGKVLYFEQVPSFSSNLKGFSSITLLSVLCHCFHLSDMQLFVVMSFEALTGFYVVL